MTSRARSVALLLLHLPAAAIAQDPARAPSAETSELREKLRAACSADVQKLCPQIERGKGMIRACLQAHEGDLSEACRAARAERAAARAKGKG
jgi:hypothetical protein